jgi:type II secretion system protein C
MPSLDRCFAAGGIQDKKDGAFAKIMKKEKNLYTVALLGLLTASAYFLADTVDAAIGRSLDAATPFAATSDRNHSAPRSNRELGDYASVLDRGLFGDGRRPSNGPGAVASTTYKLIGTVAGRVFAGAVLEDGTGQAFYQMDRKLPDGSVIIKVARNKIVLRRPDGTTVDVEVIEDAKIVSVRNSSGPGVRRLSNSKFMVDQKEVLASTENMSKILTQARAIPYLEQGKTAGFRISEIVPGSIYAKIGLQNGDIIQRVNAQDLDDPAKFFQLYQGLRNERNISIDLVRNGRRQTLNYEIR